MLRKVFFALSAALLLASTAAAATITYSLDLTGAPGTFTLYGKTSAGDNAGLAIYGVALSGNFLTVDNAAPAMAFGSKGAFNGGAGFNQVRSADVNAPTSNPVISGGQDFTNSAAPGNLVYGIGQTAGSFTDAGFSTLVAGSDPQSWVAPAAGGAPYGAILATGTYSGAPTSVGFNLQSPDLVGNVFEATGSAAVPSGTVLTQVIIPEPATFSLLGLAMVGGFGLIRRRRAA